VNIILDASVLGIGYYHRQAQTGIGRVSERLMTGLWKTNDVSLSLAASSHLPETMRYARATLGSAGPDFVNRPAERRQAAIENGLLAPFPMNSLPTKVIRQVFYQVKKRLGGDEARFDTQQFPRHSIYHSLFYPIPEAVGRDRLVKSVQTIHDLIPIFHPEWFPKGDNTVRRVLEMLPPDAQVVTISEATKQDFCGYTRADPARVASIHLAASPTLFYPVTDPVALQAIRQQYSLGDSPYLLSLATFEPRKNIDHLVRCFAQLVQGGDIPAEVKLVLVGTKGWKFDQIMNEVAQSEALRSRIVVTGFVPDEQLAALYSGALGFVYPSLYEGFGLPPLEAMQCGLPVITSSIPALAEVVGDATLAVPTTDVDALKQAMITLINSASVRAELSVKSRARAALFSWDKFIDQHVELYKTLLR
jgi:glycosyltransferase involved in cell wall biosynthesis